MSNSIPQTKITAALCTSLGSSDQISIETIEKPSPGPGDVVVEVAAAGLNHADTLMLKGRYQFKPPLPFSPGAEIAGRVEALGEGVTDFAQGDRVLAYLGWNGCRQQTLCPGQRLIRIPDKVSDEIAAGVSVTYGTAIHGLKDRGELKQGETLAVLGASGGAGLAAVEIGKRLGARVIAVASSKDKLAIAHDHGADDGILSSDGNLKEQLKEATNGKGIDVLYDCVGGDLAEPALRAMAWQGRYLVVGFASGDIPKIPINLLLVKGCQMLGVFWSAFMDRHPEKHRANIEQVLDWCAKGELEPRIHQILPLSEIHTALKILEERRAVGKVIVRP